MLLPDMACLGMIEATVEHRGKTTITRHCHLPSRALTAPDYLQAARAHWAVENGLHWVLGVVFDEDRARNRKDHGPESLATLRKLALNILTRARPRISIRRKRKRSGWSNDFARSILGQMQSPCTRCAPRLRAGPGRGILFIPNPRFTTPMHRVTIKDGETLYREGQPAESAYLILDGEMEMQRNNRALAAGRGAVIGFAGLIGGAYGSTAVASTRCDLLAFTRKELRGIIRSDPDRALQIIDGIIDLVNKLNAAADGTGRTE